MPRIVEEWRGKSDDSAIPPRVKLRIWERCIGRCNECLRKITPGMKHSYDHIKALINGGENRENNLQILCAMCHLHKTGEDLYLKSKTYKARLKQVGIKTKKHSSFQTNKDGKWKKKINGRIVPR